MTKSWINLDKFGFEHKCAICGYTKYIEVCHIIPKAIKGSDDPINLIPLCPNHHKSLDYGLLNREDVAIIESRLLELLRNTENIKHQEWLYYLLRIKNLAPVWLGHKRKKLKKLLSNKY